MINNAFQFTIPAKFNGRFVACHKRHDLMNCCNNPTKECGSTEQFLCNSTGYAIIICQ